MGYYTNFNLEIHSGDDGVTDYEQVIIDHVDYNPFDDTCKWYSFEKDMKKVSENYPNVVFKLIGEGEEAEDLWESYFKNGKMQKCEAIITYDEFDELKLK